MEKPNSQKTHKRRKTTITILILALDIVLIGILVWQYYSLRPASRFVPQHQAESPESETSMLQVENHDYSLISPLRLADVGEESPVLSSLKNNLTLLIQEKRNQGIITDASVYLRKLNNGSWMTIAGNHAYKAGSLFKVPLMICYLKQLEKKAVSLQQKYIAERLPAGIPVQTFKAGTVKPGQLYTVEELLRYMIVESDNAATYILLKHADASALQKVFTDLGLSKPQVNDMNYSLSVADYSRFFRVLYNATYLNSENSNYALKLLSQSKFAEGMARPLPGKTIIAHKFGERTDENESELSESGIIYQGDNTYLLTVMTKGKEMKELPEVISDISRITFEQLKD